MLQGYVWVLLAIFLIKLTLHPRVKALYCDLVAQVGGATSSILALACTWLEILISMPVPVLTPGRNEALIGP